MRALLSRQALDDTVWWLRSRHPWPIYAVARLRRAALADYQRVIMVVGSYGKTTTTRAIRAALGLPATAWSESNANTLGEVAWSMLREPPWQRRLVVEAGAADPGQIALYARVLRPHVTVVTWIGHEHIRAFGSFERLRDEKADAVRALTSDGVAILNADDPHVRWMASQTDSRVVWFGTTDDCHVRASNIQLDWPHGMRMKLHADGQECSLRTKLLGRRTVHNLLAAVAAGIEAGRRLEDIVAALTTLRPTRGRLQPVPLSNGAILIRDEYKATPDTVFEALRLLAEVPAKRRVVVMGNLNNVPSVPVEPHYEAVGAAIGDVAELALLVGVKGHAYLPGMRRAGLSESQILAATGVRGATAVLRDVLRPGDVVLLKGQEDERLSRIALGLERGDVRCERVTCPAYLQFCDDCPLLNCMS